MAFWGQSMDSGKSDPKRKFRFKVELETLGGGVVWYAKGIAKPTINISADTAHKFLGHTFKFPGSVTWDDIEMTLVDPAVRGENAEDAAAKLLNIIDGAGYKFPKALNNTSILKTISKGKAVEALSGVHIYQLDGNGETIEKWSLHNPFINKVSFGDLSYEEDGLSEITLGITFDWAEFRTNNGGTSSGDPEAFHPTST
jgi:hypothetical protein